MDDVADGNIHSNETTETLRRIPEYYYTALLVHERCYTQITHDKTISTVDHFAYLTTLSTSKPPPSPPPPPNLAMSEKYWIPAPYLVKLITLRGQYEDLSGSLSDFDHIYQSSHTLTPPQDSLIRWIFQETYSLWYDHVPVEKVWEELSDLVEAIPEFSEWEREETSSL